MQRTALRAAADAERYVAQEAVRMIESSEIRDWRDLENSVARILTEAGFDTQVDVDLPLARGRARVDVLADDPSAVPPARYVCECKHWASAVSRDVVHAFRSVISDAGANLGLLISSHGFQAGATEAAAFSNVRLVTWAEFQELFEARWFQRFMAPQLVREGDALNEYAEPINSRIFRKADALPTDARERFRQLRNRYQVPSMVLMSLWFGWGKPDVPELPLRAALRGPAEDSGLPGDVLDASALRPLMESVSRFYREGAAEFDVVFGGRA